jgi:7-cyano-7-deazaguanine synthase
MKKAVVLVSGGIDSSTVLAIMESEGYEIYALSFNYMQRQQIEITKIKQFIKTYNVKEHKILSMDLGIIGGSALTDSNIDVPKYDNSADIGNSIPITYVPARNTIFLSYALGYAEVIGSSDIFIGIHATDYANYPDCRPEYIKSFENMANLATAVGVGGSKIRIHAPLIDMSKSDIIATGLKLGVDFSNTISCYDPSDDGKSCGQCHACLIRLSAFKENNKEDPIFYVRKV